VRIAIVGAGFAGLGLAIRLREAGIEDFVVLDRADAIGGTWQCNTYPGCQCDVPSHLYSFSFAPNPGWSRTYSLQPEIWDYLRRVSDEHGLGPHLRLGHELTGAEWEEDAQQWRITTSQGELTAQVLIEATGALSHPARPRIRGLRRFEGTMFHSADWDHEHDLAGKRVAVIGTGASAIQFVPEIQPRVAALHLFQRTAPWVMPHSDRPISALERRLYRTLPLAQRAVRAGIYWLREVTLAVGMTRDPRYLRLLERVGRRHLRSQVSDPELRRKLKPDFRLGCKRILVSNRYYPALARDNVEVVTDDITEVRGRSIVTADGREREVDTIILGTGFRVTEPPTAALVRGRDGRTMAQRARDGESAQAYLGTTVTGYPNLFKMTGPNTGLGHTSMVFMIESQIAYVVDALRVMDEQGLSSIEVRPDVQAAFNERLQARMPRTIWASGCSSWYLDAAEKNVVLWPDFTFRYRHRLRRFDTRPYVLRGSVPHERVDRDEWSRAIPIEPDNR
jgi:cation diffusion facilitator CzcD-associated flavoprotein CzcO